MMALILRDLRLALRQPGDLLTVLMFFALVIMLFPFALGAEPRLLLRIIPGALWVAMLLANQVALSRLYESDWRSGQLEQLTISRLALEWIVLGKVLVHWLVICLPLVMVSPLIALAFQLDGYAVLILTLSLLTGSGALAFTGSMGAALTLGATRSALLQPLLILPLQVPLLIFGVATAEAAVNGFPVWERLLILLALLLFSVPLGIVAATAALRSAVKS